MRSVNSILLLGLFDTAIMTARCFQISGIKIYGLDYDQSHVGFYSKRIISQKVPDPNINENDWLKFVLQWMKEKETTFVVIPTSDFFLQLFVKYHHQFVPYCLSLIPEKDTIDRIVQRNFQFRDAESCSLNVPPFVYYYRNELIPLNKVFDYPFAIKPLNSPQWKRVFNNKGFVITNEHDLKNAKLKLEAADIDYLVQKIIEGDNTQNYEINSIFFPDGEIFQHCIRKIRQYPDRFGTATCIETCSIPELEIAAENYVRKMNLVGFTNIEFKLDPVDNLYYFIETNARVWLQVNFSMKSGINFPLLYYNYLTGNKTKTEHFQIKNGKWVDFLPDILFWKVYRKKNNLSLFNFIKTWLPLRSTSLLSFSDPSPFINDLNLFKKTKKKTL
ncbi:hypothetical protein ACFLQ5_00415 [Bacteroidota bacterium]